MKVSKNLSPLLVTTFGLILFLSENVLAHPHHEDDVLRSLGLDHIFYGLVVIAGAFFFLEKHLSEHLQMIDGSTFGKNFRITTFGESHGEALGVVIDGCPSELEIDELLIRYELDHKAGQSTLVSPEKRK